MNEVKENGFLPAIEAETEVDHLLEEPNDDCPSVNDVLFFNKENTKYPTLEDFSCEVKYSLRTDGGGMASYTTQGEDELNLIQALDGILDEIDEVEDLDYANGLTGSCEDYFLDMGVAQEVSALNHGPSDGLRFGNLSSDSHSQGYSRSSNGAVGMSETSTVTTASDTKCKEGSCKRMGRCTCLLGSQNVNKKNRKSAAMGRVSVNVGEKRRRKPPQRYIEESSKANSRNRQKKDSVVVKDKPPLWKEPKRKHTRLSESESEDNSLASESENVLLEKRSTKNVDRRKHQIMWTVQEVTKLVEGIREFGVGHWTDIKRLSFASSAYRTPIDLRDKWRNLLRASLQQPEKGEAGHSEKSAGRCLPKSLLRRVRELATLHPYPRKTKTRSSFFRKSSSTESSRTH